MERYANLNGNSNISAYLLGVGYIAVQFSSGRETFYLYTDYRAGQMAIMEMHRLARQGFGLNSYISTSVRKLYSARGISLQSLGLS